MILEDGNDKRAMIYAKEIAEKIKKRKIDKKEILVRTQLKKPISEKYLVNKVRNKIFDTPFYIWYTSCRKGERQ